MTVVSVEDCFLFRWCLHLLLIANLLSCPLICYGNCYAVRHACCSSPAHEQADSCSCQDASSCDQCCNSCRKSAPEDDGNPEPQPLDNPSAPCPKPTPCPFDCICKGAVLDRPVSFNDLIFTGDMIPTPIAVNVSAPLADVTEFSSPLPLPHKTGRRLRAVIMSFLC